MAGLVTQQFLEFENRRSLLFCRSGWLPTGQPCISRLCAVLGVAMPAQSPPHSTEFVRCLCEAGQLPLLDVLNLRITCKLYHAELTHHLPPHIWYNLEKCSTASKKVEALYFLPPTTLA